MKIVKRNVPVHFQRNRSFNEEAGGLVEDIFQHRSVHESGYVSSRTASPVSSEMKSVTSQSEHQASDEQLGRYDVRDMGEYERRVLSRLLVGKYGTVVLVGDMGSGKTSTIEYLMRTLRGRSNVAGSGNAPIIIKLNFNAGFRITDIKVILSEFRQQLYGQFRQELRHLFKESNLSNTFRNEILNGSAKVDQEQTYAAFDRFAQAHEDSVTWKKLTELQKANEIFSYIDECTKSGTQRLSVLMTLIRFTKECLRDDPGSFFLFFDNIDSVATEAQAAILAEILGYQEIAQVQALVTLRRSAFARFDPTGAFAFSVIDHLGPPIKEVITRRLKYYANQWAVLPEVNALNAAHRQAVKVRLNYLIHTKDDARGALNRALPICGASIRLGLLMCERLFINSAVPFDADPHYRDDLFRAVLVGKGESTEISPDDPCIANLLLNTATGEASLLNIRILQLTAEAEHDEANRTVQRVSKILAQIGRWSGEEIRMAFNYLLYVRRPLIWVDGKTRYDNLTINRKDQDPLHLTEAGNFYLRHLILDLVYVQEAVLSVQWNRGNIPAAVDYAKYVERFQVLRCLLAELANDDHEETHRLKQWVSATNTSITPCLFTNRIIAGVGRSVLKILLPRIGNAREYDDEMAVKEELRNWHSMINIGLNHERSLFGTAPGNMEQLASEYRDRVRDN